MLTPQRFRDIAVNYPRLKVAVLGDFCLDRYLEIDPARQEISIETGLPVHNVVRVRAQPGGAGTIVNNLVALGVGSIHPLGFCGDDGEGFELQRGLAALPGVRAECLLRTGHRHTFTYCKPLLMEPAGPRELSRLDTRNWTPTPADVEDELIRRLQETAPTLDALIVLDQVANADTGVVTARMLTAIRKLVAQRPELWTIADSRRSLRNFPPVCLKMNRAELTKLTESPLDSSLMDIKRQASELARHQGRNVFVTLAEAGMIGASPTGSLEHSAALPLRGPIDIVGAGDCVTANLIAALASGADLGAALHIASAAASVVIHQLGTTGVARCEDIVSLLH